MFFLLFVKNNYVFNGDFGRFFYGCYGVDGVYGTYGVDGVDGINGIDGGGIAHLDGLGIVGTHVVERHQHGRAATKLG